MNNAKNIISQGEYLIQKYIKDINNNANNILEISFIESKFISQIYPIIFLANVHPDKDIRDASENVIAKFNNIQLTNFSDEIINKMKEALTNAPLPLQRHYKCELIFAGAFIKSRNELKKIQNSKNNLTSAFFHNLNGTTIKFFADKHDLKGVPIWFYKNREKQIKNNLIKYKISPNWIDHNIIMKYCHDSKIRKKMIIMFRNKANIANEEILLRLIKLRQKEAEILGYKSHAHLILSNLLIETPEKALEFLEKLYEKINFRYKEFLRLLTALKGSQLYDFDIIYYGNKFINQMYSKITEIEFPILKTIDNIFQIYQSLFGLRFEEVVVKSDEYWTSDLIIYNVYDSSNDSYMGKFILDLYIRENKFGHYAQFEYKKYYKDEDGNIHHPVTVMVANFNKQHPYFNFTELITFFHEFGHIMHEICTKCPYGVLSGTKCEDDFAEAPSQMLEYWCLDTRMLNIITGITISNAEKIIRGYKIRNICEIINQIALSIFDLKIHMLDTKKLTKQKMRNLYSEIMTKYLSSDGLLQLTSDVYFPPSWTHIGGGYSSRYYGYLYSRMYAINMLEKFTSLSDRSIGCKYRKMILEKGACKSTKDQFKDFTNQDEPNIDLLVKHII